MNHGGLLAILQVIVEALLWSRGETMNPAGV